MANISDAYGTVTLKTNSVNATAALIVWLKETVGKLPYATVLLPLDDDESDYPLAVQVEKAKTLSHGQSEITLDFDGMGRWAYDSNIKFLLSQMEAEINDPIESIGPNRLKEDPLYQKELKNLVNTLIKPALPVLTFDFEDEEPCCHVHYKEVAQTGYYKNKNNELKPFYKILSETNLNQNN